MTPHAEPICQFYRLIPSAPKPVRADRAADGMMPMRAYRYCEAMATASAFGFYLFPPLNFSLCFDGVITAWTFEGADDWTALHGAQFPDYGAIFEETAQGRARNLPPTFLTALREPGAVQIWSGYVARTAPGWALQSRGPVNIPRSQGYEHFEGIAETDSWFGPLFTNIRLTHTNVPVKFDVSSPLFQVQPLLRSCYRDPGFEVLEAGDLGAEDWDRYAATMEPNADKRRRPGHYAAEVRKRARAA